MDSFFSSFFLFFFYFFFFTKHKHSKHTKNVRHSFWVYIFVPTSNEETKFRCVLRCNSHSFSLASSKRTNLQPDAATAQASHRSNMMAHINYCQGSCAKTPNNMVQRQKRTLKMPVRQKRTLKMPVRQRNLPKAKEEIKELLET